MKKGTLGVCGFVGAVILFLWMTLSWMILPWHKGTLQQFTNEQEITEMITENGPQSGIYILPSDPNKVALGKPFIFLSVLEEGKSGFAWRDLIIGALIYLLLSFLGTWMLFQRKATTFRNQVLFLTVFGFAMGVASFLPDWNWFGFPHVYSILGVLDYTIGWFLASLAIIKIVEEGSFYPLFSFLRELKF